MKHYEVVAALIFHEQRVLCVQRGDSPYAYTAFKYEFPGGKVEAGETPETALQREIQEELAMAIKVGGHYLTVQHHYPDFSITMHSYLCQTPSDQLTLREHVDAQWLRCDALAGLDWAAADVPIVEKLMQEKTSDS